MFPMQEIYLSAELDYRVERMIADRDAAHLRREARAAARAAAKCATKTRPHSSRGTVAPAR